MPRTFTEERTVYKVQELEGSAREHALQWIAEASIHDQWWDFTYEDAKTIGALMGIEIRDIYFSGFWSQGDGACFTGSYYYKRGSVQAVTEHAPQDEELHRIVRELRNIQRRNFYQLAASVTHRHRGSHEHSVDITVETHSQYAGVTADDEEALADVLRDYMRWIYRQLEKEHEYLTSEEQCIEAADANEWEFTATGSIAR